MADNSDQAARDFLLSRIDYERAATVPYRRREFRLQRMHELLERLGNPHLRLKIIHVAGTKGKGSTAAMIAAILTAAGYRTGLYTSPHLDRAEERIAIDGQSCTAEEFTSLAQRVRPVVEQMDRIAAAQTVHWRRSERDDGDNLPPTGPTYFEIVTAMALLRFVDAAVGAAVVEVGLGGRLDSTNVVTPVVSVITNISFDHMKQLGTTLEAIAAEKAGIIKPGVPVVSGVLAPEAQRAIEAVRARRGCELWQLGRDFDFHYEPPRDLNLAPKKGDILLFGGVATPTDAEKQNVPFSLELLGRHQAANAAVAVATIGQLRRQGWRIPETAVREGLLSARCPARLEVISRRPTVLIDTAHNVASIAALVETLGESFSNPRRLLIFAATQDKQVREMLELLAPHFEQAILTRYTSNPRGMPLTELAEIAAPLFASPPEVCATPADAWRRAEELVTTEHLVCVTGSFFLAADIRGEIAAGRRLDAPAP